MMKLIDSFQHRLKIAMDNKGIKQVDLVHKTGIDKTLINKYLAGVSNARQDKLTLLAESLDVNEIWLMGYDVPMENEIKTDNSNVFPIPDTPVKVPVVGKISAGLPILATENIEGYAFAPSSQIKEGFTYFYLRIQGDSMNLKFNEGDIVLVQKQEYLENDEIGVILIDGSDATVKKYKYENGVVILEPLSSNPDNTVQIYNSKEVNINIVGKVVSYQGNV